MMIIPDGPLGGYRGGHLCLTFRIVVLLDLRICFGHEPLRKGSKISSKQDAVGPAGFLSPEFTEVVAHSVVRSFRQGFIPTLAELIVPLSNLPDCPTQLVSPCVLEAHIKYRSVSEVIP